jgi:uncharacterized protein YijF (DUF1287 family)
METEIRTSVPFSTLRSDAHFSSAAEKDNTPIMSVSDRTNQVGPPLVIHHIGTGAQEEDRLFDFKLTGHYRINLKAAPATGTGALIVCSNPYFAAP